MVLLVLISVPYCYELYDKLYFRVDRKMKYFPLMKTFHVGMVRNCYDLMSFVYSILSTGKK